MVDPENNFMHKEGARQLSLDSQQFLQHVMSVDGDELYQLLVSEQHGASQSPSKLADSLLKVKDPEEFERKTSDGAMLADMMHSLMDEQQQHGHGEPILFSEKTVNMIFGEQLREIAEEVAADMQQDGSHQNEHEKQQQQAHLVPGAAETMVHQRSIQDPLQQRSTGSFIQEWSEVQACDAKKEQQYLTLLDGNVLQREDGTAVIATLPEGQAQLTVPIPGSSSMLQYIPILDSTVVPRQTGDIIIQRQQLVQTPSPFDQKTQNLLSPSQTEQLVADAAKQRCQLQQQDTGKVLPKPQLRPVDSDGGNAQETEASEDVTVSRQVSHKRERSLTTSSIMVSESLRAPESKQSLGGGYQDGTPHDISPNSSLNPLANTPREEDCCPPLKPMKLFSDGLEIDEEMSQIIDATLCTPAGGKRRGRPPGRSKSNNSIPGFVEPSDTEILANILLDNPELRKSSTDELKKLVRKEKNRISAAFSRYKMTYEMKLLESKVKKLEAEKTNLSEWLQTTPEVQPHRILLADGHTAPLRKDPGKKPPVRHLSL